MVLVVVFSYVHEALMPASRAAITATIGIVVHVPVVWARVDWFGWV